MMSSMENLRVARLAGLPGELRKGMGVPWLVWLVREDGLIRLEKRLSAAGVTFHIALRRRRPG